jgi:hypothetical protein
MFDEMNPLRGRLPRRYAPRNDSKTVSFKILFLKFEIFMMLYQKLIILWPALGEPLFSE